VYLQIYSARQILQALDARLCISSCVNVAVVSGSTP
jgi:hypothetical protein